MTNYSYAPTFNTRVVDSSVRLVSLVLAADRFGHVARGADLDRRIRLLGARDLRAIFLLGRQEFPVPETKFPVPFA
jgi:hypothetical protein